MVVTVFATLLLCGALLLALWADVRLAGGPAQLLVVTLHVAAAALSVILAVEAMSAVDGSRPLAVLSVMAVFLPSLVYFFTSAIWLLRVVQRSLAH